MFVRPKQRHRGTGFSKAIGIGEAGGREQVQRLVDQFERHLAAAIGNGAQAGNIGGSAALLRTGQRFNDARQHGRHHKGIGDALGLNQLEPAFRRERWQHDDAALRVDRAQHRRNTGDVIGRNRHQRGIFLVCRSKFHRSQNIGEQIGVGENGRLWRRGGAAGEQLDGNALSAVKFRFIGGFGRLSPCHEIGTAERGVALVCGNGGDPVGVAHHQRRGDSVKQPGQILIRQTIVQRAIGHAGQRRAKQGDNAGLAAFIQQGDMGSAALMDDFDRAARRREQFPIGPALAVTDKADAVGRGVCRHFEEKREIHGRGRFGWCGSLAAAGQSDAGSGLASLVTSATPSTASDPLPGLTQSNSY